MSIGEQGLQDFKVIGMYVPGIQQLYYAVLNQLSW